MDCVVNIVKSIAGPIAQSLMQPVSTEIGYVLNYDGNIRLLNEELQKLRDLRDDVEERVKRGSDNGERVKANVQKWLRMAQESEQDIAKFLECEERENQRWCILGVFSKYGLGKEAKKKIESVLGVKGDGNFTEVAYPAQLPEFGSRSSNDYQPFESRARVFREIMESLKDDEIKMIGVYGMGGVGKTRMVEEVGEQAKKDSLFDKVVITTISQSLNVRNVQDELAGQLGLTLNKESPERVRAGQLCNRLKNGKKTLVIIDDVWKEINLKEIGIPIPLGDGCKIVLTSRSQGVCMQMMVQKDFEIGVLSKDEAWVLFQTKVGNSMFSSPEMLSVAEDVCRECGGLPVALLAVGAVLMKSINKQYAWNDVLEQLRNSRLNNVEGLEKEVHSRLELSYNYLEQTDAKKCFLLCCLFQEDAEIFVEQLLEYGMGMRLFGNVGTIEKARNRVQTLVDYLKTSCLLLEGRWGRDFVKMHDVVRDVAISIASKNRQAYLVRTGIDEWLEMDTDEHYTSISLWSMHIGKLPNGLECPNLRLLVLECDKDTSTEIPPSFFKGMEKLEVLDLRCMSISSPECSISHLTNLRMLCLYCCNLVNISFLKGLKELENLSLRGSKIKEFGLEEVGQLTRLRRLDLSTRSELGILPTHVIANLSLLEELYIDYLNFPDSEVELEATDKDRCNTSLSVTFSKDRLFEKLTRFRVCIGGPSLFVDTLSSRILCIYGTDPLEEHWVQVLLLKAEALQLRRVHDLNNVFHDRDGTGFLDLKDLRIYECHHDREYIIGEQKWVHFCKLSTLIIINCCGLKHTVSPSNARGLLQVENREIGDCESMDRIIGNEEHDNDEEKNQSIHIQPLFNEKVAFPALEILQIQQLKMKDIWQKKLPNDSFCHLKELCVYFCHNLGNVFSASTAKSLVHLKELRVVLCEMMEEIVTIEGEGTETTDKIVFHQLAVLKLRNLPALGCFCSSRSVEEGLVANENVPQRALFSDEVAFPALEILQIQQLKMKDIWQKKLPNDSFCHLKELHVYSCHNLGNVFSISTAKSLVHLKELRVVSCEKMEEIVTIEEEGTEKMDKIVFHQLVVLKLKNLPALGCFCSSRSVEEGLVADENVPQRALFSDEIAFPCLKMLGIEGLSKLTEIWQSNVLVEFRARFPTLRYCKVEDFDFEDSKDKDEDEDFDYENSEDEHEVEDIEDEDFDYENSEVEDEVEDL